MDIQTVKMQANGWLVNGSMSVPASAGNRHTQMVQDWIAEGGVVEPEFTQAELDAQAEEAAKQAEEEAKLAGVEFEGVMCSATKEDMWGLSSIKEWVLAGNNTSYEFENGNKVLLTSTNWSDFEAVWIPFRASFF